VRLLTAIADETARAAGLKLLDHVAREAHAAGLDEAHVETTVVAGEAFACILHEAQAWKAELIVMAVSHRDALRSPYVGSQTEHVLEFAECPVLIVPHD
jgi:nucleotide-binding universal stress UspA family protein